MIIRPCTDADAGAVWAMLQPVLRAAEVFALPADWSRSQAMEYWCAPGHEVFIAEHDGRVVGSYYLRENQQGGGSHVANCGYLATGDCTIRGVGGAMCAHSLGRAAERGFRAMQFNFVVSTNERAVALWQKFGFRIVGTLPRAFRHPSHGFVDALVMFRDLQDRGAA